MPRRAYNMGLRAATTERTTQRIYTAAVDLFGERPFAEVTLQTVADRAGVSLQTVLRKFGSKEALYEAAAKSASGRIMASREPDVPGNIRAAIEKLVASYEEMGHISWRALTQEEQFPFVRELLGGARASHRLWIESSFAHLLPRRAGPERERRVLLLSAATDFYVWKLYRKDLAIGREATLERMIELAAAAASGGTT